MKISFYFEIKTFPLTIGFCIDRFSIFYYKNDYDFYTDRNFNLFGFFLNIRTRTKKQKQTYLNWLKTQKCYGYSCHDYNKNVFNIINWCVLILGILSAAVLVAAAFRLSP